VTTTACRPPLNHVLSRPWKGERMCLTVWIEAEAAERERLMSAAATASEFGLRVDVEHPSRWPWAQRRPVRATITEDGGCACGLLSDDADWNAETWAMRPEIVEPLARTLEALLQHGPPRVAVEALWDGDRPQKELCIGLAELAGVVRSTGLGTKARYVIERAG